MSAVFLHALQLASPGLPIGAYAYSQGLEWAVEAGWVRNEEQLKAWLEAQLSVAIAGVDVPLYARLHRAVAAAEAAAFSNWNALLLAHRETSELRADDTDRGGALLRLLRDLKLPIALAAGLRELSYAAAFALAAAAFELPLPMAVEAYVWSWLEGQVLAGVKLVPLGQVAGQRLLLALTAQIPAAIGRGLALDEAEIGGALPALALASALHETQYTRLFRS